MGETIEQLRLALTKQERFFANVMHDIKNRMALIAAYSEMALNDEIHESEKDVLLKKIYKACTELSGYMSEIVFLSKAKVSFISVHPKKFPIAHLASEVIGMYEERCFDKDIKLENLIAENQEVLADYDMVYSVISNLVGNAVKFTPKGGRISISGEVTEDNYFQIRVKDSGVGIDLEKFALMLKDNKIYTTQGTEGEPGTGLGLLLCKELVADNGGTFWAEHNADGGSSMLFTLPTEE